MKHFAFCIALITSVAATSRQAFAESYTRHPPLRESSKNAKVVFYCTMKNSRMLVNKKDHGESDMVVHEVFIGKQFLGNKKNFVLDRYIPAEKDKHPKFIVFCDLYKGKLDAYYGVSAENGMVEYYKKVLAVRKETPAKWLMHYFQYLDNANKEIAGDALLEFRITDYKHARTMARRLQPNVILRRLENAKRRIGMLDLYAKLLANCGEKKHAQVLEKYLAEYEKTGKYFNGEGLLTGMILLDAKRGWRHIRRVFKDRQKSFVIRYCAVNALKFLRKHHPEAASGKQVDEALALMLPDEEVADLAIEYFWQNKRWEMTDAVLDLYGKKSHKTRIVQWHIACFAVRCPSQRAEMIIADLRNRKPKYFKEIEEYLRFAK